MNIYTFITTYALLCGSTAIAVQNNKHESTSLKTEFFANIVAPTGNLGRDYGDGPVNVDVNTPIEGIPCYEWYWPGEYMCIADDFPVEGLITVFFGCFQTIRCDAFGIYQWDTISDIDFGVDVPQCTASYFCGDTTEYDMEIDCSNLVPSGTPCAVQECSDRSCIEAYESQSHIPPPTEPADGGADSSCECFLDENGLGTCYCLHYDGIIAVLQNCPRSADGRVYFADCAFCTIVEEDTISQIDSSDRLCTSCTICPEGSVYSYAQDCANIYPNDPCMVDNCDGQCIGGTSGTTTTAPPTTSMAPPTSTTPTTMDGCELDQWTGTQTCRYQDAPFQGLTTSFNGCPTSSTSLTDCQWCTIVENDSSTSRQADARSCNSCTMCSPGSPYANSFDCANLVQGNPCSIQDCSGNCIGEGTGPGFPTPRPSEPILPGFGSGGAASLVVLAPVMMILVMLIAAMGSAL